MSLSKSFQVLNCSHIFLTLDFLILVHANFHHTSSNQGSSESLNARMSFTSIASSLVLLSSQFDHGLNHSSMLVVWLRQHFYLTSWTFVHCFQGIYIDSCSKTFLEAFTVKIRDKKDSLRRYVHSGQRNDSFRVGPLSVQRRMRTSVFPLSVIPCRYYC